MRGLSRRRSQAKIFRELTLFLVSHGLGPSNPLRSRWQNSADNLWKKTKYFGTFSVDKILALFSGRDELRNYGLTQLTEASRKTLKNFRTQIKNEELMSAPTLNEISEQVIALIETQNEGSLKSIVNLTGTVLHTQTLAEQLSLTFCR